MGRNRARVSVTVDPGLLEQVDAFVAQHLEADRSKVFDTALGLWAAEQRRLAMEAQFEGPDAPADERAAWAAVRGAAAAGFGRR